MADVSAVLWVFARELQPDYLILRVDRPDKDGRDLVLNDGTLSPTTQAEGLLPCSVIDSVDCFYDAIEEWVAVGLRDGFQMRLAPDAECEVVTK